MSRDMLEMVDVLANEKNVEKSAVFGVLETALASAVKKAQFPGEDADVVVSVDRGTGDWTAKRRWVVVSGDEGLQQPDREEMLSDVIDDYPEIKVGDYIEKPIENINSSGPPLCPGRQAGHSAAFEGRRTRTDPQGIPRPRRADHQRPDQARDEGRRHC